MKNATLQKIKEKSKELRTKAKENAADQSHNVIWTPLEKQVEIMQRKEYECLFGGAAGGGNDSIDSVNTVGIMQFNTVAGSAVPVAGDIHIV